MLFATAESSPRRGGARSQREALDEFFNRARVVVVGRGEEQHLSRRHREPHAPALQQCPGAGDHVGVVINGVEAVDLGRATGWSAKAEERFNEGRLARTVRPEEGNDFANVDVKCDVGNGSHRTKLHTEVLGEYGVAHGY